MNTFTTVEEYIAQAPAERRPLLQKVREIIRKTVPDDTLETISYQMPTYRHNGNIIHFALFKNHLGIYPGPAAIEHFAEELSEYKTSKGAVQIPFDQPLPEELIGRIVHFNLDRLKDRQGPSWHKYKGNWKEAEEIMQRMVNRTELQKEFKWGTDIYTLHGKNVVGWGGFKDFFSIWFYNGVFLEDKEKVLIAASEGKTKALRQWRFTRAAQMDEKKILAYILESIQTVKDGKEIKPEKSRPLQPGGLLKEHLGADTVFQQAFERLTPGKQKEYIEYIEEAKQEKTKLTRLEKIRPLVCEGKGLNDKYKK